jgi:hypothetical protein
MPRRSQLYLQELMVRSAVSYIRCQACCFLLHADTTCALSLPWIGTRTALPTTGHLGWRTQRRTRSGRR